MNRRGPAIWASLLLAGTVIECWALRRKMHEHTLSHFTRLTFRTNTRNGRIAFIAAWAVLTGWFTEHVCTEPER